LSNPEKSHVVVNTITKAALEDSRQDRNQAEGLGIMALNIGLCTA
jgi:hypothetical protein